MKIRASQSSSRPAVATVWPYRWTWRRRNSSTSVGAAMLWGSTTPAECRSDMIRLFCFSPSRLALLYIVLSVRVLGLFAIPLWYV